jgi:hypothetical protein
VEVVNQPNARMNVAELEEYRRKILAVCQTVEGWSLKERVAIENRVTHALMTALQEDRKLLGSFLRDIVGVHPNENRR